MRFTRYAEDECWRAVPSPAGPAGAVSLGLGPVDVEFDRIDLGRIVTVVVYDDPDAARYLETVADALGPLAEDGTEIDVDISDTPLWLARHPLAMAAHLADDYAQLAAAAAGLAAAELADVLHTLGDLAPDPPGAARETLELAVTLLRDARPGADLHPEVDPAAVGPVRRLGRRLVSWAPEDLRQAVEALGDPRGGTPAEPLSAPRERPSTFAGSSVRPAVLTPAGPAPPDHADVVRQACAQAVQAIRLEPRDPAEAARRWRHCAQRWLGVEEAGRAAVAYDRAADAAAAVPVELADPAVVAEDRRRARACAATWALPFLDGHSGVPFRPVWTLAYPTTPEPIIGASS